MRKAQLNAQRRATPAQERTGALDWGNLRFFLELARTGSLSRAAARLGVDRNTVGRRVVVLEEELGLPLFERGPQGWSCTAAGEELAALASRVEEDVLALARHADARDRAVEGTVKLTTSTVVAVHLLAPDVPALRARHPGLVLEIAADHRAFDLNRREADVAIRVRVGRPHDTGLVARRLSPVAYGFYGSPTFVAERRGRVDLARDPMIASEESPQERWLDEVAPGRRVVFRCNSTTALAAAARTGVGAAVLPCFAAEHDPRLARLEGPEPAGHELWLLVHGDLRRAPRVGAVIGWVDDLVDRARAVLAGADRSMG